VAGFNGTATDEWLWTPADAACSARLLQNLTRESWCTAHAGARLLLVGDSLSMQHYDAAMLLVGDPKTDKNAARGGCDAPSEWGVICHAMAVCNGSVILAAVRSDHLVLDAPAFSFDTARNVMQYPVAPLLAAMQPTLVLLNRGAHWVEDNELLRGLESTIAFLQGALPAGARILLRNTPAGHLHCEEHSRPLAAPLSNTELLPWHWGDFARQNGVVRAWAAQRGLPVLDFAGPTLLRPDWHLDQWDCLHYLVADPRPVFTWVRLEASLALVLRSGNEGGRGSGRGR